MSFSGYSNTISFIPAPTRPNENQFVPLSDVDTNDWSISKSDTTELVCNNSGVWNLLLQYQIIGQIPVSDARDATIIGWLNINGVDVSNSAATQYAARPDANNVLAIGFSYNFNAGDIVKFGIRSQSTDGNLNVIIQGSDTSAGIQAPSFILTMTKA